MEKTMQVTVKAGLGGAATTSFGSQKVSKEDGGREEDGHSDMRKRERDGQVFRVTGEPVSAPPGASLGAGSGMLLPGDLLAAEAEPVLIPKEAIE